MFAHVTAGTVDSVGNPPQLVFIDGRWWDLRDRDPATLALVGWYVVQEATMPADTATHTSTPVFTFNGTLVVQSWTVITKTPEQIADDLARSNEATIRQLLDNTLPILETITNYTNAQLVGNTAAAAIKDEARALRRIIRLLTNNLTATN